MSVIDTDPTLITQAYLYGFPLVFNLDQVNRYVTEGVGANPATPFNAFGHAHRLAGPDDTFVTSTTTPSTPSRRSTSAAARCGCACRTPTAYYVLQVVDAWTNNIAYVGHRATGTGAGDFLIAPPGFTGEVPDATPPSSRPRRWSPSSAGWPAPAPPTCPASNGCRGAALTRPPRRPVRPGLRDGRTRGLDVLRASAGLVAAFPPAGRTGPSGAVPADRPARRRRLADPRLTGRGAGRRAARGRTRIERKGLVRRSGTDVNGWQLACTRSTTTSTSSAGTLDDHGGSSPIPKPAPRARGGGDRAGSGATTDTRRCTPWPTSTTDGAPLSGAHA